MTTKNRPNNVLKYQDENKNSITLTTKIGSGGEGAVYTIQTEPGKVAKIWHDGTNTRFFARKLNAMSKNKPITTESDRYQIIWPEKLIYDQNRNPAGFIMPKLESSNWDKLLEYYTPIAARDLAVKHNIPICLLYTSPSPRD